MRPLAPSTWHGTAWHGTAWQNKNPSPATVGRARVITPNYRFVNPQGGCNLLCVSLRDQLQPREHGRAKRAISPAMSTNGDNQETIRGAHAIYANTVDTDEHAAQGLRRLGKQARLHGTQVRVRVRWLLPPSTALCRLGNDAAAPPIAPRVAHPATNFSASTVCSGNPWCLDQSRRAGTPSSTCLRCHHLVSAKVKIQNARSPT